jgi:hypothetical protein
MEIWQLQPNTPGASYFGKNPAIAHSLSFILLGVSMTMSMSMSMKKRNKSKLRCTTNPSFSKLEERGDGHQIGCQFSRLPILT